MKYLVLIYSNPANWAHPMFLHQGPEVTEQEREEMQRQSDELAAELQQTGELIGGQPLADPSQTRTVRVSGGEPVSTDGPFVETKEQLAGYFLLECDSRERAVELAKRVPDTRFAPVEVRPVMEMSGAEM